MSGIIIDPSSSPIQQPPDAFWDKPVSRRNFQEMLSRIGKHLTALNEAVDTCNIMLNYIMEVHLMKDTDPEKFRADVDAWVEKKKALIESIKEQLAANATQVQAVNGQEQATDEQPTR